MSTDKIYGIRHHGPGCARSLLRALKDQQPDLLLVEAPAEVDSLVGDAANPDMKPPVAALLYQTDAPAFSAFYPYARFSPEWQALQWAHENKCPLRHMDLPAAHYFALQARDAAESGDDEKEGSDSTSNDSNSNEATSDTPQSLADDPAGDPFAYFAQADGYTDGERWWNDKVEERPDCATFFDAVLEAVTALRTELARPESERTLLREAWMRKQIRAARREGFKNIAIVCGAWHAPVLAQMPKVSQDNALLKGMPKVKVSATWTPWTYERLTSASGYGAGIRSPGWYDHLWSRSKHPFTTWMTKAARVLRKQELEGSSASIIEATRLSESLAGLRGRAQPGLDESLEAIRTVFCAGDATPMALLQSPLLIGKAFGKVPDEITNLPLQRDIEAIQKRLRLKPVAELRELALDLREESARNRSVFLHRLLALRIRYGRKTRSRSLGTFKENWRLQWEPRVVLDIVDASRYGNTLESAASNALLAAEGDATIDDIAGRLDLALLADLTGTAPQLVEQLNQTAATTTDAIELMQAVPALVRISRYGDVRKTDGDAIREVLEHLIARVHVALPLACAGLADDMAGRMTELMRQYAQALSALADQTATDNFFQCLGIIANAQSSSPQPAGCAARLLYDANTLDRADAARLLSYALSPGNEPDAAAAWIEGFLSGSGAVLVHDTGLLALIDTWLSGLTDTAFTKALPLLRRTFGQFAAAERSQIGQVIQAGNLDAPGVPARSDVNINIDRTLPAWRTVARLFQLPAPTNDD